MSWIPLSLGAAFFQALNDVISKRFFSHLSAYEMGLVRLLFALPFLLGALPFVQRPALDTTFWMSLGLGLPLELLAFLCYMRAIKVAPLSITIPFLAFTPAFVIATGHLILGETLTPYGIAGIGLIVAGSYLLNLSWSRQKWYAPFSTIIREQGSRLMLLTAFLYSLTATLGKLAIQHSSPQFFGIAYFVAFALFVLALFPFIPGTRVKHLFERPVVGLLGGMTLTAMIFSHTLAISLVQAAYMISLKRSSLLFSVLFGAIVFREEKIRERFLGASVMMAGVLIIGFLG